MMEMTLSHSEDAQSAVYGFWYTSVSSFEIGLVTNSIWQSPSWQAYSFSTSQEIPRILWNPNVLCLFHNSPTIVSNSEPDQPSPISSRSIVILSSHLLLGFPGGFFPFCDCRRWLLHTEAPHVHISCLFSIIWDGPVQVPGFCKAFRNVLIERGE